MVLHVRVKPLAFSFVLTHIRVRMSTIPPLRVYVMRKGAGQLAARVVQLYIPIQPIPVLFMISIG